MSFKSVYVLGLAVCIVVGFSQPAASQSTEGYYKKPLQFHYYPDPDAAQNEIGRLGPIGLGLELRKPAFTMFIKNIEDGSPAAATGKLKVGQIIASINGETLKDIDPRVQLGNMITRIEATDGRVRLMIKDKADTDAYPVEFKIPALGSYSETWPVNCEKSDTIVRNFADWLARQEHIGWGGALFLLSTGEEQDLDVLRSRWSGKLSARGLGHPWSIGYSGPAVCEYYLRTGDESVLPAIEASCDYLKKTIYNGSWMGRGGANYGYMAGGHMNAAGVHSLTFLLMAKECGVAVDEHTLQTALVQFYRFVGHGNVPYGDGLPESGYTDNGRVGGLAFAMAAAANLTPEGDSSVYAKARDISATKSFYSTSWLFHGHTGGGIGELWRGPAMGLVREKRPLPYRTFMDERRWMYELARTHAGSFGWAAGQNVSYTQVNAGRPCGNYIPLIYTLPRKKLRLYGAPPTQYSKTYTLPERPWGTVADDMFFSLTAGEYAPGKRLDVSKEQLLTDASKPIMDRLSDPTISDEMLLAYALHIDQGIRSSAAGRIVSHGRLHLILPLLKSADPRGRLSGLQILLGRGKNASVDGNIMTDEMFGLAADMVNDPEESWWVVESALRLLGQAHPDLLNDNLDRLAYWLQHDEWWLRRAALVAVTPIVSDERCYRKVLPIVGEMITNNERAVALSPVSGVVAQLQNATPEIQQFGVDVLGKAYSEFPEILSAPGGQNMASGTQYLLDRIAALLVKAPSGFDELYTVSKQRFPDQMLPHKTLYLAADPDDFGPKVKDAFRPMVLNNLIPKYMADGNHIASNKEYLSKEAAGIPVEGNFYYREPRMDHLVWLYQSIGVNDYDWHVFGPDLSEFSWQYYTFDPPEKKLWAPGWRYREVTLPEGMENWYKPEFDAKSAGWKTGRAPFGCFGDKKEPEGRTCDLTFCRCGEPVKTFWEKEVLLIRTRTKLPPLKKGHRYRLCIGGMSHVNRGDGYEIYIDGKLVRQRKTGVGKRAGGRPECYYVEQDLWPASDKDVTIAAKAFLSIPPGKRSPGFKSNTFSIFFEEMKVPPLTDELFRRGQMLKPMRSSAWQTSKEDDDLYHWDGDFVNDQNVIGTWSLIGKVDKIDAFESAGDAASAPEAWLQRITFSPEGITDNEGLAWSGDILMDLKDHQALSIVSKTIAGAEYLLIEAGGFSKKEKNGWKPDHPDDWSSPFFVMKREQ